MAQKKKNFLLLSLEDKKAKKVANVVNNESCSKILDYLADKEATETQIAKDLKLPGSTVNYNLKQLLDAKLITWENFHYSQKGKEVKHYTVANKYIIIAPKGADKEDFLEKVKGLFPAFLFSTIGATAIYWYNNFKQETMPQAAYMMSEGAMEEEMVMFDAAIEDVAIAKAAPMSESVVSSLPSPIWSEPALWFFIGAVFAIVSILIWRFVRKK